MVFIPVPDAVQVNMQFQSDQGILAENVFHCASVIPGVSSEQSFIGNIFADWWDSSYAPLIPADWNMVGVTVRDASVEAATSTFVAHATPGTHGGGAAPNSVASVITWYTGFAGRSFRGRTFLLSPPASETLENTLVGTYRDSITVAAGVLVASLATGANNLLVVSKFHNSAPRTTAVTTPVTEGLCRGFIASQRNRLR